jgi:hypothetical protein
VVITVLGLLGVHVTGWLDRLWDTLTGIGLGYLVAGWSLQTLQASPTALGWYFILRAGWMRRRRTGRCSPPTPRASR